MQETQNNSISRKEVVALPPWFQNSWLQAKEELKDRRVWNDRKCGLRE